MLLLYVATKYDYGDPRRGLSFEHANFYDSLANMGIDVIYFDPIAIGRTLGKDVASRKFIEVARAERPDVVFACFQNVDLTVDSLREVSEMCLTVHWFCDDHWRFENFTRKLAPAFTWAVTTAQSALPKYAALSHANVIKSQWACNHFMYRPRKLPLKYDVTFVGQPHGIRRHIIADLADEGIHVRCWGHGWPKGRLSQDRMIQVFEQSRINLNLTNASTTDSPAPPRRGVLRRVVGSTLRLLPGGTRVRNLLAGLAFKRVRARLLRNTTLEERYARLSAHQTEEQIKGRNFEVPGCGGFLLSGNVQGIGDYYEDGKEIVCFEQVPDLVEKIKYYLGHEDERAAIAEAGLRRTLREHTYVHRFRDIFRTMGLEADIEEGASSVAEEIS